MVNVNVPAVTVCAPNVYTPIASEPVEDALYSSTVSNAVVRVTVGYTMEADGVHSAPVPDTDGAVAFVTVTPPAVYPVPVTSPVVEYAVVAAPIELFVTNSAAFTTSAVVTVRTLFADWVPRAWVPFRSSDLKLEGIACTLADMMKPLYKIN